jgi:hypothetical protein
MALRPILGLAALAALALPAAAGAQCDASGVGTCSVVVAPPPSDAPAQGSAPKPARTAFTVVKRRVWRLRGSAEGFDSGGRTLHVGVRSVGGLSPRLAARLRRALGDDADVLVGPRTRVQDAAGRQVNGEGIPEALDEAVTVLVTGRLAAPGTWRTGDDGTPVPAVRALRVKILA